MRTFEEIFAIACDRKDDVEGIISVRDQPKSISGLAAIPDDRWLSCIAKGIFQAGFNWKVVDRMWSGFEDVFKGFDIAHCAMLNDEDLELR